MRNTSDNHHSSDAQRDECPTCGGPIRAVECRGPTDVFVQPCGHDVSGTFARDFPRGTARVRTDGGSDECPECGGPLRADGSCSSCQRWPDDYPVTDGGHDVEDVDYWTEQLQWFLENTTDCEPDEDIGLLPRHNANDIILTPVDGSTRDERASLIRELELGGFTVTSSTRDRHITVDAPSDRLPSDYTEGDE